MPPGEAETLQATILVVDDIAANRNVLRQTLEREGYEILLAPDGETAVKVAAKARPDVILLDVMMPGIDGFETCRRLKADPHSATIPVIFISAQNETRSMVDGFRAGGVDYIAKPFQAEEVLVRVRTHLTNSRLTQQVIEKNQELEAANLHLRAEIERRRKAETSLELADAQLSLITEQETEHWGLPAFIGRSAAMKSVIEDIRKLQLVDNTSVLVCGESGTGKELVARALHFSGRRSGKAFIAVNCAAVPGELAESLFFGHVKGAFSGATSNRKGYFEMAAGGTLFLDEIGDMPRPLQAKLLRTLEDGTFMPVGAESEKQADVRLISATNADLAAAIRDGSFRKDLYYRLAGYEIRLQALRDRPDDIELLIAHFLERFRMETGLNTPGLDSQARQALIAHDYPGNIRELKSILERATIESRGDTIEKRHLHLLDEISGIDSSPGSPPPSPSDISIPMNLEQAEIALVRRALAKAGGNVSKAAELLGINRTKVYRILSQSGDSD